MALAGVGLLAGNAGASEQQTISFYFSKDEAGTALVEKYVRIFEERNPDIKVTLRANDRVLKDNFKLGLRLGVIPDVALTTAFSEGKHYLEIQRLLQDPDAFASHHADSFDFLRTAEQSDKVINGFIWNKTLNMPFVNVSLFRQAGVPVPKEGDSLEAIVAASARVAKATNTPYAFVLDRSSHRWKGIAHSYGSVLMQGDKITFPDAAAEKLITQMYNWKQNGSFAAKFWGTSSADRKLKPNEEFIKGNVVTYFSGNWQVDGFSKKIGDRFEWTAIDTPCGATDCFPMPGGDALVGINSTRYPKAVARFIEFMGSEEVQTAFAKQFVTIPGGDFGAIDYQNADANVNNTMGVFLRNRGRTNESYQISRQATAPNGVDGVIIDRLSEMFAGQTNLDETLSLMKKDVATLNAI